MEGRCRRITGSTTFWRSGSRSWGPDDWYAGGEEVDDKIKKRFTEVHKRLKSELPSAATDDARTALAAIIVFDQLPRNIYRGSAEAFSTDDIAVQIARRALDLELDKPR